MLKDIKRIIADFVSLTISLGSAYCLKFSQDKSSREAKKGKLVILCDYVVFFSI